jgi:hypothetical protein
MGGSNHPFLFVITTQTRDLNNIKGKNCCQLLIVRKIGTVVLSNMSKLIFI